MAWSDGQSPRLPRRMADEIARRLDNLIEATEVLVRHHAEDHDGPLCLTALHAKEMIERAKEARGALCS